MLFNAEYGFRLILLNAILLPLPHGFFHGIIPASNCLMILDVTISYTFIDLLLSKNFIFDSGCALWCCYPPSHIFQFFAQKKVHGSRRSHEPNFRLHIKQLTDIPIISAVNEIVYSLGSNNSRFRSLILK